jgi:hypothetical protein
LVKADADKCYFRITPDQAKEALRRQAARLHVAPPPQFPNGWDSVELIVDAAFAEGHMFLGGPNPNESYGRLLGLSMGGSLSAHLAKVVIADVLHRCVATLQGTPAAVLATGAYVDDTWALTQDPEAYDRALRATDPRVLWNDIEVLSNPSPLPTGSSPTSHSTLFPRVTKMRLLDCLITPLRMSDDTVQFHVEVALKDKPPAPRTSFTPWRVKVGACRSLLYRALRMPHSFSGVVTACAHAARMAFWQDLSWTEFRAELTRAWRTSAGPVSLHVVALPAHLEPRAVAPLLCSPISSALVEQAHLRWRVITFRGVESPRTKILSLLNASAGSGTAFAVGWRHQPSLINLLTSSWRSQPPEARLCATWSIYRIRAPDGSDT